LYRSLNVVRVVNSRMPWCAGNVARWGERKCIHNFSGFAF